jgi:RNA polymerase sigma-70 factor (ECF subfamily)
MTALPATAELDGFLAGHHRELAGYCYRMLGSAFDAEDAVQEVLVRAWRGIDRFEGRASLRTWLHRIATNVCFDMLEGRRRRALPSDLGAPGSPHDPVGLPRGERWVQPMADRLVLDPSDDPAEAAARRDSIRLAFVAALQVLPPRQRAVLILRDVLRWSAAEVADLLGTSVAAANSLLRRARATLAEAGGPERAPAPLGPEDRALLDRYMRAFERYDVDALVGLLHEDAVLTMPPQPLWLSGREDLRAWWQGEGTRCRGSRLVPHAVCGRIGFAQYQRSPGPGGGPWLALALQVPTVRDGAVARLDVFTDPALFPALALPVRIP